MLAHRLGEDLVGGLDPGEGAGSVVPLLGEAGDHGDELLDAGEAAPTDGLTREEMFANKPGMKQLFENAGLT